MADAESNAIYEADKDGMEEYIQEHLSTLKPICFAIHCHAQTKIYAILKTFLDELHYNYGDPLPWIMALAKRMHIDWQPTEDWTTDEDE